VESAGAPLAHPIDRDGIVPVEGVADLVEEADANRD
jgi:hypothetical protein